MKIQRYSLGNIVKSPRGAIKCDLLEGGSIIASVVKKAPSKNAREFDWQHEFEIKKFYSERAKARFDDFCNCLSMAETIDALYTHSKQLVK